MLKLIVETFFAQVAAFWNDAPPLRQLLIKYAVATILQSVLVSFLFEAAVYSYCIFGFAIRPPVEGIPFFRISVFALAFLALSVFHFSTFTLSLCLRRLAKQNSKRPVLDLVRTTGYCLVIYLFIWMVVGVPILSPLGLVILGAFFISLPQWVVAAYFPKHANLTAIVYGTLFAICMVAPVMSPTACGNFLRRLKFGGGVPITVEFEESGGAETTSRVSGYLLVRSTTSLILVSSVEKPQSPQEINLDYVRRIIYTNDGSDSASQNGKPDSKDVSDANENAGRDSQHQDQRETTPARHTKAADVQRP